MLGVTAVNLSVKRMEKVTDQSTILTMQTATAMNHITQNGFLAIGSRNNPGIVFAVNVPPTPSYFSFRQDINFTTKLPNNTPAVYTDDQWVIYTDGGIANQLYTCIQDAVITGPIPNTNGACRASNNLTLLTNLATITYRLDTDTVTPNTYFYVRIETRANPAVAASPITNPSYALEARINPPLHSWTN